MHMIMMNLNTKSQLNIAVKKYQCIKIFVEDEKSFDSIWALRLNHH